MPTSTSAVPCEVELTTPEGRRRYPDLHALSRRLLGQPLPVAAVFDWIEGRPWSGAPFEWRDNGFSQLGWSIGLQAIAERVVLAHRPMQDAQSRLPSITIRAKLESTP